MKICTVTALILCAVGFFSSCYVYFTSPPFRASEHRFDDELLGYWERDAKSPRDLSSKYRFTRRSVTVMDVWADADHLLAVTYRIGDSRYIMAWDPKEKVESAPKEFPGPYFAVAAYSLKDGKLVFRGFDLKKFSKLYQEKKIRGFSIGGGQWAPPSLYITSPPAEARKAIGENGFKDLIWKEGEWLYNRSKAD